MVTRWEISLLANDEEIRIHVFNAFSLWMRHRGEARWTVDYEGLPILERLYDFSAANPPELFLRVPITVRS